MSLILQDDIKIRLGLLWNAPALRDLQTGSDGIVKTKTLIQRPLGSLEKSSSTVRILRRSLRMSLKTGWEMQPAESAVLVVWLHQPISTDGV